MDVEYCESLGALEGLQVKCPQIGYFASTLHGDDRGSYNRYYVACAAGTTLASEQNMQMDGELLSTTLDMSVTPLMQISKGAEPITVGISHDVEISLRRRRWFQGERLDLDYLIALVYIL